MRWTTYAKHRRAIATALVVMGLGTPALANEFTYDPPGVLVAGSGQGRADETVYAPGMRFPMEAGPAYPNSQVWGHGGSQGPGGGQCHANNYSYPWQDNYCETRSWNMPLCPSGTGHQGQDIRPATCDNNVHWEVAAEAGTITNIGSYSVYVTTPDGTRFDHLHGASVSVSAGQSVTKGQRLCRTSNAFGGTPTTIHLHFNIRQDVGGVGIAYVPPYMSLVKSYEELMGYGSEPPHGPVDAVDCESVRGWAFDPDAPGAAVEVQVWFGGPAGDPAATGVSLMANEHRDDLCDVLGSCGHGFTLEIPRSLRDEQPHPVYVYAVDEEGNETVQLEASPGQFQCAPPPLPDGVRRKIASPEVVADWQLSLFWDLAKLSQTDLDAVPEGEPWPEHRLVVQAESGSDLWLIDRGLKRAISPQAAEAWSIATGEAQQWPDDSVEGVPLGPPLRGSVFLVSAPGDGIYVIDDDLCPPDDPDCEEYSGDEDTGSGGSGNASDGGTEGDGGSTHQWADAPDDSGCGCASPTRTPAAAWALVALPLVVRRRRRRAR
jgi:MYXO-CTERM domain-containing protein